VKHPVTPDGRYFVVRGKLWRMANPGLDETTRADGLLIHGSNGIITPNLTIAFRTRFRIHASIGPSPENEMQS
jgi:hypothetical protein